MANLQAVLEKRGVASVPDVSEAVARSQLHGGALTTNLLEVAAVDETALSAALSECFGLPAAPVGPLRLPPEGTALLLPREVAERYCCFPLESPSGELVLAVPEPLERSLREELSFALGVPLIEKVAPEVRIREAISRQYGAPLSARDERALARLEGELDDAPQEKSREQWSEAELSKLPRPPSDPPPADPDVPEWPREPPRVLPAVERRPQHVPPSTAGRARRRGPFSLNTARDELARAMSRDEVLDVFFGFACQYFEYSALFAVHSALAEGLNAWGPGSDREAVQAVGVPLDLPSSLSEAAETGSVRLAPLGRFGIDRTLAVDLRRQFDARVLILPVCLRGRCAVLLYGDNGSSDVLESEIADVVALAPDVANAFGRIILLRKRELQARQAPEDPAELSAALTVEQPVVSAVPRPAESSADSGAPDFSLSTLHAKNLDKSRSNGRSSSKSEPAPRLSAEFYDDAPLQTHSFVSIEAAAPAPEPSPTEGLTKTPTPQEDLVFLLAARAAPKEPLPPAPAAAYREVFQSGITRPRSIVNQPRLPSVIVDEASRETTQRTRASAVTNPPLAARETLIVRRAPEPMEAPTLRPALGRAGKPGPAPAASAPVAPRPSPERTSPERSAPGQPAPMSPAVEPAARPPAIVAGAAMKAAAAPVASRPEPSSTATTAPPPTAVSVARPARPSAPEPRAPYPLAAGSSPAPPLAAPAPAAGAASSAVKAAAPTTAPASRAAAPAAKAAPAARGAPAAKVAATAPEPTAPAAATSAPGAKVAATAPEPTAPAAARELPAPAAPSSAAAASSSASDADVAAPEKLAAERLAADKLAAAKLAAQFPPAAPMRPLSARPGAPTQAFGHRPLSNSPRRSSAPPPAMPRPQSSFPPPAAARSGPALPKRTASVPAPSSDSLPSAKPAPRVPTARPPVGSAGRAAVPPPAPLPSEAAERPAPAAPWTVADAPFAVAAPTAEPSAPAHLPPAPAAPPSARGAPGSQRGPAPIEPAPPEANVASVDPQLDELVELLCQGNTKAAQDLVRIGEASLPSLMARFPGPVVSERAGPNSRASECGPLLQALANIGSPALPDIMRSSEDRDAGIRRWATLLLGEIPGPEACRAVVQRLADDVPRVHQAALDAARLLLVGPAANLFRKTLFEVAEAEDAQLTLRLRTLEHVARLKDSASVPRLIALLSLDTEPVVHKALWALTVITRHDFGRDVPAWTDWWQTHQSKHRFQWLIEALDHSDIRLRKAAGDELQLEAKESFGYSERQAQPERQVVQQRYREWWETTGARRYGRVQ